MTHDAGATATLNFVGTGFSVFGARRDTHGNYSVQIDQELFIETGFHSTSEFNISLFEDYGLNYGDHTITITNMPASNRSVFDLDSIVIERELGPPGHNGTIFVTEIDDTASSITYKGEWTQVPSTTAFEDTLHLTTQASAQVTVSFQGSTIELYGRYANAPFVAILDTEPPISLAGPEIDLAPLQQHPQTLLYLMDGLNENQIHTVTLTNLQSNVNRPFFFDYAIVRSSQQYSNTTKGADSSGFSITSSVSMSSASSSSSIIGGVVGGVLGFLFLCFVGFLLFRRYNRGNFFRRLSQYGHEIMPYIIPDLSQRQQNTQQVPCTGATPDLEKISNPSVQAPPAVHYVTPYGISPYGTLYSSSLSPSVQHQSALSGPASLQRSNTTTTSSSSTQLTGKGGPDGHTLTLVNATHITSIPESFPVHEEDAGHRVTVTLPPAYNSVWPSDMNRHQSPT
ncbi:hypothetical protein Clacol_000837 [Clathrus columnatus]|uniref:Transmembrane protein n=1 Tax=Clathrus columnatus TaxID=1419009 RepID=A0AAV5A1X6_9AGAM|nr:hypothetical protein Clacol_000837 [Clathrus columnatus]